MSMLTPAQIASLSLRFATTGEISSIADGIGEVSEDTKKLAALVDQQLAIVNSRLNALGDSLTTLGQRVTDLGTRVTDLGTRVDLLADAIGSVKVVTKFTPFDSDWKKCDGSALLVENYSTLYSIIGNSYGGDSTNFNLPNYNADLVDPLYIIKVR